MCPITPDSFFCGQYIPHLPHGHGLEVFRKFCEGYAVDDVGKVSPNTVRNAMGLPPNTSEKSGIKYCELDENNHEPHAYIVRSTNFVKNYWCNGINPNGENNIAPEEVDSDSPNTDLIKRYRAKPPEMEIIEVTRENLDEVSGIIGADTINITRYPGSNNRITVVFTFHDGENITIRLSGAKNAWKEFVGRDSGQSSWRHITHYDLDTNWEEING